MRGKYVYIAGPIAGTGNPNEKAGNVWQGMRAALNLIEAGHYPYCPHLSYFLNRGRQLPRKTWLALSMAWLKRSDAVLRLPGFSSGATKEVARAYNLGIPVYWNEKEFYKAAAAGKVHRFKPVEIPTGDVSASAWNKGDKFPGTLYGYPILWRDDMESLSSPVWELRQRACQDPVTEFSTFADYEAQKALITFKRTMSGSVEDQTTEWGHLKYLGGWPILWERDEKLETRSAYAWELRRTYEHLQLVGDKYVQVIDTTPPTDDPEMRERLAVPKVVNTAATPTVCSTCGVVNCNLMGRRKEGAECFAWIERSVSVAWDILRAEWQFHQSGQSGKPPVTLRSASDMAGAELVRQKRLLKAEIGRLTGELVLEKKMHEAETLLRREFSAHATEVTMENVGLRQTVDRQSERIRVLMTDVKELEAELRKVTEESENRDREYNELVVELHKVTGERDQAIEDRHKITFTYKDHAEITRLKAERDEMERQRDLFVIARDTAMNLVDKEVAAREAAQKDLGHQVALVLTVDIERRKALRAWEAAKMARDSAITQRNGARQALNKATNEVSLLGRKLIVRKADVDTARRARDRAFKGSCRRKCPFRKESL